MSSTTTAAATTMDLFNINTTAWLSTTASQIFFMQLGFLCYEVGFVKPVWTQSVILKNIEDTFVGVLTFLAFGYTLTESEHSFYGIIAIPTNPLLIGIDVKLHDQILISAFFASTCATIISGAVLERMKNKAYIVWCILVILVNYSFVSHWIWHEDGWLNKMGFVDGAGSVVVHSTAGMAGLIAVWKLGPRRGSINDKYDPNSQKASDKVIKDKNRLEPVEHASRPVINAIGAFFLWFGWFAFNVSSPIAFSKGIGDSLGTTALVTVISPICASCSAFLWMYFGWVKLRFEELLSCLLCGLVAITGMCHTCSPWEAAVVGFLASPIFFATKYFVRYKCNLDDPLQIVPIHLMCGIYSCIGEGIVANNVYGTPGLLRGGFKHFGVQLLGITVVVVFNCGMSILLWNLVLTRAIFKGTESIRVSILDIYLGTRLFDQNYDMALDEVLNCESNPGKKMLLQFHKYIADRFASEQLDFLLVVKIYNNYLEQINRTQEVTPEVIKSRTAKYLLMIIDTYVSQTAAQCINISGTNRAVLLKIRSQLLYELKSRNGKDLSQAKEEKQQNDDDLAQLEGIWKDTPNVKESASIQMQNANKSASILSYQVGSYKSSIDITTEKVFNQVYVSVWKIVRPHFTQFLRHSYKEKADKATHFDVKIPFKLEKNWTIEWDESLVKEDKQLHLVDTVPLFSSSGTLLSKLVEDISTHERRVSGINQIQLAEVIGNPKMSDVEKENVIIVVKNDKTEVDKTDYNKVSVVID